MVEPSLRSALAYCVNQVRSFDYTNYIWSVQLPKELRAPLIALRAFNVELTQIPDNVRQEQLMQIRMQWWRDAVKSAYTNKPQPNPVIQALHATVAAVPHTQSHLLRMVSTLEADYLRAQPPKSLDQLEQYAEGSSSQLLYLQGRVAGVGNQEYDHAASHLGKAVGIANLLRGTAYHAARRRCYLPSDLCMREGVSDEDVLRGQNTENVSNVVFQVATQAKGHLEEARALSGQIPGEAKPLMLPAVAVDLYLAALEKHDFNVFATQLQSGGFTPLWYQILVKYNLMLGKY
ncbi:NADH dehydrogenase (ubiquinone) complex I, assembly factor [Coccomyxa sp. Obi]|nr:NADH dehydrogenase (ubiquinone) complex I, assembly factor [Coccomyxa sp. Obi]